MAESYVTRTFKTLLVNATVADVTTKEVDTVQVKIKDITYTDKNREKAVERELAAINPNFKLISIDDTKQEEKILGITESFFLQNAVEITRGKKEVDEN